MKIIYLLLFFNFLGEKEEEEEDHKEKIKLENKLPYPKSPNLNLKTSEGGLQVGWALDPLKTPISLDFITQTPINPFSKI